MSDEPQITDQSQATATTPPKDVPLSDHAEDVLAETIGHEIELTIGDQEAPLKTVKQVLAEMVNDKDELSITLEYGTGESGVDQASWEIEVTTLQRAYMRKQMHASIDKLSTQIEEEVRVVQGCVDPAWIEQTSELRELMKLFEQSQVNRQEIDDYQHRIFGRNNYMKYIESILDGTDIRKLLNAASNLKQVAQQLSVDHETLTNPEKVDNAALADAIIAAGGDIDALSIQLERDYSSAIFRRNIAIASRFNSIISEEFLKKYKLWAHSFDLNVREVLATEKSATNGRVSEKSRAQLKDMLQEGASQINQILQVVS